MKVRIGIIGVGNISRGHIAGLRECKDAVITAICDIDKEKLYNVGNKLGIEEKNRFIDYKELIASPDVDAVEICTPNYLHVEMANAVLNAGKPVNIEKPLSTNYETAKKIEPNIGKATAMMCFSYRFMPAVRYAKWILEQGMLGKVINANVEYLKSSAFFEGRELEWRFVKEFAGTGVLGDLGVHLIDMTRFLLGNFESVCGHTEIIVKERKKIGSNEIGKVETDDFCSFMAKLSGGIIANYTITRCAIGQDNTIKYDIYGTDGVISFNLNNPNVLGVCIGKIDKEAYGMHEVVVPNKFRKGQEETFIDAVNGKIDKYFPDVTEGVECQKILEAICKSSDTRKWELIQ